MLFLSCVFFDVVVASSNRMGGNIQKLRRLVRSKPAMQMIAAGSHNHEGIRVHLCVSVVFLLAKSRAGSRCYDDANDCGWKLQARFLCCFLYARSSTFLAFDKQRVRFANVAVFGIEFK